MNIDQATLNQITAPRDVPAPRRSDSGDSQDFSQLLDKLSNPQPQPTSASSSTSAPADPSRVAKPPKRNSEQPVQNVNPDQNHPQPDAAESQPGTVTSDSSDQATEADQPAPITTDETDSPQPQPVVIQANQTVILPPPPVAILPPQNTARTNPQPLPTNTPVIVNHELTDASAPPQPLQSAQIITPSVTPSSTSQPIQPQATQPAPVLQNQSPKPQPTTTEQPAVKIHVSATNPAPKTDARPNPEVAPSTTAPAAKPAPPTTPTSTQVVIAQPPKPQSPAPTPAPTIESAQPPTKSQPVQPSNPQQSTYTPDNSQQQFTPHDHNTPPQSHHAPSPQPALRINQPIQIDTQIQPTVDLPSDRPESKQLLKQTTSEQSPPPSQTQTTTSTAPPSTDFTSASPDAPAPSPHTIDLAAPAPATPTTHTPNIQSHSALPHDTTTNPPDTDAAHLTDQVSRGLRAAINQRGGTVTLHLTPPDLGALRIQVRLTQGVVQATFETSTHSVGQLIQQHMQTLRRALESQGLTVDRIQVHVQQPISTPGAQAQTQQDNNPTPDGRSRGLMDQNTKHDTPGGGGDQSSHEQRSRQFQRELLDLVA